MNPHETTSSTNSEVGSDKGLRLTLEDAFNYSTISKLYY
jgi:hypothetical protein